MMTLNDSPSFQDYAPGKPEKPNQGKKRSWVLIAGLFVIAAILALVNFMRSESSAVLRGSGSIDGKVVDTNGMALYQAEVFLEKGNTSTLTDANGGFLLSNVPAGEHVLVAGYQGFGVEHEVSVQSGATLDAGSIVIEVLDAPWVE